jgi:hypothetical protein
MAKASLQDTWLAINVRTDTANDIDPNSCAVTAPPIWMCWCDKHVETYLNSN